MAVNRYYSSTAVATTLTGGIDDNDTTMPVGSVTGFPVSYPYTLILDPEGDAQEVVEVTGAASTTLTITRGVDGTSGTAHGTGTVVWHGGSARDFREAQEHIAATQDVHGLSGGAALVGTTSTQTLTNKTISGGTLSGTLAGSPTFSGNPTFSGAPVLSNFSSMAHDHGDADDGGNIPQASVTGLVSALAAKAATRMAAGYQEKTSNMTLTASGDNIAQATVTAPGSKKLKITTSWFGLSGTVAGTLVGLYVYEDGVLIGGCRKRIGEDTVTIEGGSYSISRTPSAGDHTYLLKGKNDSGTGTVTLQANTAPANIIIEQIED